MSRKLSTQPKREKRINVQKKKEKKKELDGHKPWPLNKRKPKKTLIVQFIPNQSLEFEREMRRREVDDIEVKIKLLQVRKKILDQELEQIEWRIEDLEDEGKL